MCTDLFCFGCLCLCALYLVLSSNTQNGLLLQCTQSYQSANPASSSGRDLCAMCNMSLTERQEGGEQAEMKAYVSMVSKRVEIALSASVFAISDWAALHTYLDVLLLFAMDDELEKVVLCTKHF